MLALRGYNQGAACSILDLSDDILQSIFNICSFKDLVRLEMVCKPFRSLLSRPKVGRTRMARLDSCTYQISILHWLLPQIRAIGFTLAVKLTDLLKETFVETGRQQLQALGKGGSTRQRHSHPSIYCQTLLVQPLSHQGKCVELLLPVCRYALNLYAQLVVHLAVCLSYLPFFCSQTIRQTCRWLADRAPCMKSLHLTPFHDTDQICWGMMFPNQSVTWSMSAVLSILVGILDGRELGIILSPVSGSTGMRRTGPHPLLCPLLLCNALSVLHLPWNNLQIPSPCHVTTQLHKGKRSWVMGGGQGQDRTSKAFLATAAQVFAC